MLALLPVAVREFRRYLLPLVSIFTGIALLVLAWGLLRSPTYQSSTTVVVSDASIIAPLMEGRPVTADDGTRAVIAREIVFGRRVMDEILKVGGWLSENPTPLERDKLIKDIVSRTEINITERTRSSRDEPQLSVIKITYSDSDPKRAHAVASRYSQMLIEEASAAKARDSRAAYRFIDGELKRYEATLSKAEISLERYRNANPDVRPGADTDVAVRIGELRRTIDNARLELVDLQSQEAQLRAALSRESEVSTVSRASQSNARLSELLAERSRLLQSYTEQHPDVVRVQSEIRDLRSGPGQDYGRAVLSGGSGFPSLNPIHGQLRAQLADVRARGAAAASRLDTAQALLAREYSRSSQIVASEGTLSALTRNHDINREIYEDLMKRRENAHVAMNLNSNGRALGFRIQEPASMPMQPSGVRLMHFVAAGLVVAAAVPLLLLSLVVKHDPHIRTTAQIERDAGLPVLGVIPAHGTRQQQAIVQRRNKLAFALFLTIPLCYGAVLLLKLAGVL